MQIGSIEQVIDKLLIFTFNQKRARDVNGNVQILTQIKSERPRVGKTNEKLVKVSSRFPKRYTSMASLRPKKTDRKDYSIAD